MFDKLFEPIQIRGMELRNRVVMSAMGTHESAESEDGKSVTDKLIAYHVARAKGGNGDTDAHGCTDEERHPRACTGFVRLFGVHGFGVFGREEPHRRPPANILRRQPVDNHPKKEDQHRIEHPSFGRSQAYHREIQGTGSGRSCFPRSEQRQL